MKDEYLKIAVENMINATSSELVDIKLDGVEKVYESGSSKISSIVGKRMPVKAKNPVYRNDLCPCNSGKKYKKCCML